MRRNVRNARPGGFTLIELLTVIAILALLISIMVPSLSHAKKASYRSRSQTRIKLLSDGATAYKMDNGYYPGQRFRDDIGSDSGDPGSHYWKSGSELLACAIWSQKGTAFDASWEPESAYSTFQSDMMGAADGVDNTLLDSFPEPMPVLYYPARLGSSASTAVDAVFDKAHNSTYAGADSNDLYRMAAESRFGGLDGFEPGATDWPVDPDGNFDASDWPAINNDSFILIAPGIDREYFTSDDVKNF